MFSYTHKHLMIYLTITIIHVYLKRWNNHQEYLYHEVAWQFFQTLYTMFGIKSLPLHNLSSHSRASFRLGLKIFPSPMTFIGEIITATDSDNFLLWMLKNYSGVKAPYNSVLH